MSWGSTRKKNILGFAVQSNLRFHSYCVHTILWHLQRAPLKTSYGALGLWCIDSTRVQVLPPIWGDETPTMKRLAKLPAKVHCPSCPVTGPANQRRSSASSTSSGRKTRRFGIFRICLFRHTTTNSENMRKKWLEKLRRSESVLTRHLGHCRMLKLQTPAWIWLMIWSTLAIAAFLIPALNFPTFPLRESTVFCATSPYKFSFPFAVRWPVDWMGWGLKTATKREKPMCDVMRG